MNATEATRLYPLPLLERYSETHDCPCCGKPLAIMDEAGALTLYCPWGECPSIACNTGNHEPKATEAEAFAVLERFYQNEVSV